MTGMYTYSVGYALDDGSMGRALHRTEQPVTTLDDIEAIESKLTESQGRPAIVLGVHTLTEPGMAVYTPPVVPGPRAVREAALARAVLDARREVDECNGRTPASVAVGKHAAALALAVMLRECETMSAEALYPWLRLRVAAADVSRAIEVASGDWVEVAARTVDLAHESLCRAIEHGTVPDLVAGKLAAAELATALNTLGEDAP